MVYHINKLLINLQQTDEVFMNKKNGLHNKVALRIERISSVFLFAMFGLFPLVITDYGAVTKTKYIAFLVFSLCYIGVAGFLYGGILLDGYRPERRNRAPWYLNPEIYLGAFLLSGILSYLFSPYKGLVNFSGQSVFLFGSGRYDGFLLMLLYALVFFFLARFGRFERAHVFTIAVVTVIMCGIGIVQLCGVNVFGFYPEYSGRLQLFIATIGNLGLFSGVMCVFLPLLVTDYLLCDNSVVHRIMSLVGQLLAVYVMLAINISSGKVALLVTVLVLLPIVFGKIKKRCRLLDFFSVLCLAAGAEKIMHFRYLRKEAKTIVSFRFEADALLLLGLALLLIGLRLVLSCPRTKAFLKANRKKAVAALVIALVVVLLVSVAVLPGLPENEEPLSGRAVIYGKELFAEFRELFTNGFTDKSGNYRIGIWKNAFSMGLKNPVFGTGIGTFYESFRSYAASAEALQNLKAIDTAHNEYLQLFCTMGAVGLAAYLAFLVALAIRALRRCHRPAVMILGSGVLCYCIQAFFSFNIVITTPLMWICGGLLYKQIKEEE